MKKTTPREEYTVAEWYSQNYPQIASVYFDVLENGVRVGRASEFVDFSGELESSGNEPKQWRVLKPKKFFDDRSKQREYLIKEIQKLYAKDKTKSIFQISFSETGLSEADESEMWPVWNA